MGDIVEDIIAEPEDLGYLATARSLVESYFQTVHLFFASYGWFVLLGGCGLYYLWTTRISPALNGAKKLKPKSPEEEDAWQRKEEQRLKAIQRLQEKYQEEAAIKAEKMKALQEKKDRERREELEKLQKSLGGEKLGSSSSSSKGGGPSLRPEYNPLMGDSGSSGRVCNRRPGGGAVGG